MSERVSSDPWDPSGGGLFSIGGSPRGGGYERLWVRSRGIQKKLGSDRRSRERYEKPETPTYVEGERYTRTQLSYMADDILRRSLTHPKAHREDPAILLPEHYKERTKREIYVQSGMPDPSVESGLYWRTHPQGRGVNTDEARQEKGASFYR